MKKPVAEALALAAAALLTLGQVALAQQADPSRTPKQAGKSPVKVFILAGQSNMEGQGVVKQEDKDGKALPGTLVSLMSDPARAAPFKHLKDAKGEWAVREDVWVYSQTGTGVAKGGLTLGYGWAAGDKRFLGPELQFGHVLANALPNQILIIKTAWGGKSLYKDFRPPSSGGEVGPCYTKMLDTVDNVLKNLKAEFPNYDGSGYELAGFVWYHGWNDGCDPKNAVPEYERNLVNLIKDLRKDLKAPHLPVVIGELTGPWVEVGGEWGALRKAQAAAAAHPELKGNVTFVETHDFVRKEEESPGGWPCHEFNNAETYFLVGNALGEGMKRLLAAPGK